MLNNMWVEQSFIKEGDTVKVEFTNWTKLGTKIGVVKRFSHDRVIIDFGDVHRWLDRNSSFLVYQTHYTSVSIH